MTESDPAEIARRDRTRAPGGAGDDRDRIARSQSTRSVRRSLLRWSILLALGLLLPWIAERQPQLVERLYSKLLFPPIATALGWIGSIAPFSIAQIVVLLLAIALLLSLAVLTNRLLRRDRVGLLRWSRGAMACLAILVWTFELAWGLQYARPPLASRLQLSEVEPTPERLASLTRWLAEDANRSHDMAVRTGEIVPLSGDDDAARQPSNGTSQRFPIEEEDLLAALSRAYRSVEPSMRDVPFSAPKRPRAAGKLLSRLGISGIYFPFTGEATVNALLPPISFPFTAAHEMAHQRGIAREDEANFLAFLACREAGFWYTRYAGSLGAYLRVRRALWKAEPDSVRSMGELLGEGPQADVQTIRDFWARYEGPATAVAEQVNDTYLKANRQEAGVASYDLMVRILVAFQEDGLLDSRSGPATLR